MRILFPAISNPHRSPRPKVSFRQTKAEFRRDSHYLSYPSEALYGSLVDLYDPFLNKKTWGNHAGGAFETCSLLKAMKENHWNFNKIGP